jgi:hypothetical protein
MRLGAESTLAISAAVWACLAGCADRPLLEAVPRADLAGDASAGTPDSGTGPDGAPDVGMPEPPGPLPWKSGFRLRARIVDGGEGAKLFAFWQDTVLRLTCSFAVAADGRVRCLPLDEDLSVITTFFADSDCTRLVAIGPAPEQPYVRIVDGRCGRSDDDPTPVRVVRWGGAVNVAVPYILRSGVCSPIVNGPDFVWNAIGDADPVQFVAATEQIHSAGGRSARILMADDGARENARLLDPGTGRACEVVSDHVLGGPDVCVPTPFAAAPVIPFFSAEGCNEAVAFAEEGCHDAFAGLLLRRVDCKFGVDVVELGPWFATDSASMFRRYADGICRPDMLFSPMTGYPARQPFAANAFATAGVRSFGSGRLEARLRATPDGVAIRNPPIMPLRYQLDPDSPTPVLQPDPFEFYDNVMQTRCRVAKVAGDTLRCIPTATVPKLGEYFEDEACTVPAHLGANDAGCPSAGYVTIPGWLEIGLAVPPPSEIRAIGAVLDKPIYMYAPFPIDPSMPPRGTCVPAPSGPDRVFYALGPPIPVAELAPVSEASE